MKQPATAPYPTDDLASARTAAESGRTALLVLSLISGLGGVVYEVLYMRHLSTVLGDMFYVHAALLGIFLLGNGVGAWIAHRFVRHLWAFELVIGIYAVVLPFLIRSYEASFLSQWLVNPVTESLVASALLLAVPSTCIGISIPLFSAYVRAKGEDRDAFKVVYLLYNLGAALSVLVVDFFLIRRVGFRASLLLIGLANLSCGLILLLRRADWVPATRARPAAEADPIPRRSLLALLLASVGSALFMGFYIKVCYHLFLPQRENFAICTSISVLSIALGTALVRRYRLQFSTLLAAAILTTTVIYTGLRAVVIAFHRVEDLAPAWATIPREIAFGLLLSVPYVFLGATIPALLQREGNVARRSGTLLLVSGIGNAAGLVGFMLFAHPLLDVFTIPVLICMILAVAMLIHDGTRLRARQWVPLGAGLLLLPVLYARPEAGVYLLHEEIPEHAEVVHYKSFSDNVSYVHTPERSWIRFNGQPSIFITGEPFEPRSAGKVSLSEAVSGIIPALVAPRRDEALVLGLGSGITAGAAGIMFRHTDVVDINAAFFPLVERIRDVNFDVANNPAATILHDDARSYLASTKKKYDVIINSVPSPTYFAAGKIYTAEFLDMVKRALRSHGVYSGWFTPGDMSTDGVTTLLATLRSRFEYCNLVILRQGYYFTNCADEPLTFRDGKPFPEPVRKILEGVRGVTLDAYFASVVVSDDIFEELDFTGVALNTDDFPILEFQVMRLGRLQQSVDPILAQPARFNIHPESEKDEEALLNRALVIAQIHTPLFQRAYAPYLARNPKLGNEYNARVDRYLQ